MMVRTHLLPGASTGTLCTALLLRQQRILLCVAQPAGGCSLSAGLGTPPCLFFALGRETRAKAAAARKGGARWCCCRHAYSTCRYNHSMAQRQCPWRILSAFVCLCSFPFSAHKRVFLQAFGQDQLARKTFSGGRASSSARRCRLMRLASLLSACRSALALFE